MFECEMFKAWKDAGPKQVKEEAPQRVKREGWYRTRNALAVTVRYTYVIHSLFRTLTILDLKGMDDVRNTIHRYGETPDSGRISCARG